MSQPLEKSASSRETQPAARPNDSAVRARLLQMIVRNEEARKPKSQ